MGCAHLTQGNQGWKHKPPERLLYDLTCLCHEAIGEMPDLWHSYQYLDNFDLVAYRLGVHECSAIQMLQGADYEQCEQVLPTMRVVPLDHLVLWLRRNETTEKLLRLWREGTDDWGLALLRAVYLAKPMLYLLPAQCYDEVSSEYLGCTIWATHNMNDWTCGVFDGEEMLWRGADNEHETAEEAIAAGKRWIDQAIA